jgi:hypothetical protein
MARVHRILVGNVRGDFPPRRSRNHVPIEKAVALLKECTGQDFGHDVASWEQWFEEPQHVREFELRYDERLRRESSAKK